MSSRLLRTTDDSGPTLARLTLAFVFLPHGAQHVLGWLGGYGFHGTLEWMTGTLGFPTPLAVLALVTELLAPFALLVGIGGRVAALGLVGLMLGALTTHWSNGFFMNWFGSLPAGQEGFEYHLLAMALAGTVVLQGSGAWSIDRILGRRTPAVASPVRRARAA
ncbi:MAG TPA: DoxX family protein [Gemmatimonadales bacterium]|nr:DoxX family protein [Gemmatimonadales bacterium]